MLKILSNPKLEKFLNTIARKFAARFRIDPDDIMQAYFAELLSGNHPDIEHVAFGLVSSEYKRGIVGISGIPKSLDFGVIAQTLKQKNRFLESHEMIDYLFDLKKTLSDKEYQLVVLHLAGMNKMETYEATRGTGIPRREFNKIWQALLA